MTCAPASRKASAAPKPILYFYQPVLLLPNVCFDQIYPEVPPTTTIFLSTNLSASFPISEVVRLDAGSVAGLFR